MVELFIFVLDHIIEVTLTTQVFKILRVSLIIGDMRPIDTEILRGGEPGRFPRFLWALELGELLFLFGGWELDFDLAGETLFTL